MLCYEEDVGIFGVGSENTKVRGDAVEHVAVPELPSGGLNSSFEYCTCAANFLQCLIIGWSYILDVRE